MFDGGPGILIGVAWMLFMWGIPLLLVVALLKYLFTRTRDAGDRPAPPEPKSALDLLKESYARGEIGRDEFLQKRDDLLEK
ncbi:SHOCT domain-containing protein [Thiobacillus sedimenti]|uniref:SHOCT domain-containing protein n=1 Tax=Thiobacillus sedimenti TaxID=3110231 RepID=A0ABZ1CLX8_9PROT|nr:SHOCT domain-containing protein [Thiobacillus sp. SCUT-2]WRS40396.1 SHOCT domain-containing protein [Thiobacillus sp. SCUT-2]